MSNDLFRWFIYMFIEYGQSWLLFWYEYNAKMSLARKRNPSMMTMFHGNWTILCTVSQMSTIFIYYVFTNKMTTIFIVCVCCVCEWEMWYDIVICWFVNIV